jgi:hypothetical protein
VVTVLYGLNRPAADILIPPVDFDVNHISVMLEVEPSLCLIAIPYSQRLPHPIHVFSLFRPENVVDVILRWRWPSWQMENHPYIYAGNEKLIRPMRPG